MIYKNLSKKTQERLPILIDFMRKQPPEKKNWNMQSWFGNIPKNKLKNLPMCKPLTPADIHACGTTACAMGYAATVPKLKKLGLSVFAEPEDKDNPDWGYEMQFEVRNAKGKVTTSTEYGTHAARDFFDMEDKATIYLFGGHNEKTPAEWADRAQYFLQTDGLIAHDDN